jgi:hypothetical protein
VNRPEYSGFRSGVKEKKFLTNDDRKLTTDEIKKSSAKRQSFIIILNQSSAVSCQ